GQAWQRTQETDDPATGHWTSTLTFTDRGPVRVEGRDLRKIGVGLAVTLSGPVPVPPGTRCDKATAELKSHSHEGTILFDPAAGRVVRSEGRGRRHLFYSAQVQGPVYEDEQKLDESWTITVTDKDPLAGEARQTPAVSAAELLAREDKALPRQVTN